MRKGNRGVTHVRGCFEDLDWATYQDERFDFGTDLFVTPPDDAGEFLGVLAGVQVKNESEHFERPETDEAGNVVGWWWTDRNRRHVDYWINHALPHFLVLHDRENKTSYWVQVTDSVVRSTGKGVKILVPAENTLDNDASSVMRDFILQDRPQKNWHGSLWSESGSVSSSSIIRHAMLVPRMIAPHGNANRRRLAGPEALALRIQLRDEIERVLQPWPWVDSSDMDDWGGLTLEEATTSEEWAWRATAALHRWLFETSSENFVSLEETAQESQEQAAAAVLRSFVHFEDAAPSAAHETLTAALEDKALSSIDAAWIQVHQALALTELGRSEEAFDLALQTMSISDHHPNDITASSISGAAASIAFTAAPWSGRSIQSMVRLGDNASSWWRAQPLLQGLSAHIEDTFRQWSDDGSIIFGKTDTGSRHLTSAMLLSFFAADGASYRRSRRLLTLHQTMAPEDTHTARGMRNLLENLRLSGDSKAINRIARKLRIDGPLEALTRAVAEVDLDRSTRTTALSDISLLTQGGDLLPEPTAEELVRWILATLRNPKDYLSRVRPTFDISHYLYALLSQVAPALGTAGRESMIDFIADLDEQQLENSREDLSRLLEAIPKDTWTAASRRKLEDIKPHTKSALRDGILRITGPVSSLSREEVSDRISKGAASALYAIPDIALLPETEVLSLLRILESLVARLVAEGRTGSDSRGGLDAGRAIVLLNWKHPAVADWSLLQELLGNEAIRPHRTIQALGLLADIDLTLTEQVREELLTAVRRLRSREPDTSFAEGRDHRGVAAEAEITLAGPENCPDILSELIVGGAKSKASAAQLIGRHKLTEQTHTALALTEDSDPSVQRAALYSVARLSHHRDFSPTCRKFLVDRLRTSVDPALAILHGLDSSDPPLNLGSEIVEAAESHPSALVRNRINELLRK